MGLSKVYVVVLFYLSPRDEEIMKKFILSRGLLISLFILQELKNSPFTSLVQIKNANSGNNKWVTITTGMMDFENQNKFIL